MELGLRGKRALITGASKGIGYAVAEVFAEEGCHVDMASRDPAVLEEAAQKIRSAHQVNVRTFAADLSKPEDRARLVEACGDNDILVNNAGSNPAGALEDIDDATWRASWDLKVFGYINMTRAFYARMKAAGVRKASKDDENLNKFLQLDAKFPHLMQMKKVVKALEEVAQVEQKKM